MEDKEQTPQIGDYYCSDGKFHSVDTIPDKVTMVGVVFSTTLTKDEVKNGFKAYVMALNDVEESKENTFVWRENFTDINCDNIIISYDNLKDILQALENRDSHVSSQQKTATKDGSTKYVAICSANHYEVPLQPESTVWFIPGYYHWNLIINKLLNSSIKFDETMKAVSIYDTYDDFEQLKKKYHLSGQYWMYPSIYNSKRLIYVDFDSQYIEQSKSNDGERMKIRPIALV